MVSNMIETFTTSQWNEQSTDENQQRAISKLESGDILYLPELTFSLSDAEKAYLTPEVADPQSKNIGYHPEHNKLWGVKNLADEQRQQLKAMMRRYAGHAQNLIQHLLPQYHAHVILGRTSFRPVQISNRKTS